MKKTILITGASSGFGKACAEVFAQQGYKLILAARRYEKLEELKASLGVPVHIVKMDIRNRAEIETFVNEIPHEFSEIDILINNAGLALGSESIFDSSLDEWETMVDTNIKGLMNMTWYIAPIMKKRGVGYIINIGSIAGAWPYLGGNTYGGTKAFVAQFSRNLRCDFAGTGIRVTNIEPGLAETEFSIVRYRGDVEKANNVYKGTQPITGKDIADIINWIAHSPKHVNINSIEIMATQQTWAGLIINREI